MRLGSLSEELEAITKDFDYGIVPGSATVFVKDEINDIGRLDLTLLEGVMIVLEVTKQSYKVVSCSPLSMTEPALSTAKLTQSQFEKPFEAMETLLMEISPMFKVQFEKLLYAKLSDMQSLINKEEDEFFINHSWY